jgi:hypothetical protein
MAAHKKHPSRLFPFKFDITYFRDIFGRASPDFLILAPRIFAGITIKYQQQIVKLPASRAGLAGRAPDQLDIKMLADGFDAPSGNRFPEHLPLEPFRRTQAGQRKRGYPHG